MPNYLYFPFIILFFLLLSDKTTLSQTISFPFHIETVPKHKSQTSWNSFLEHMVTPVILNTEERACIQMCFGTPKQCFKLEIQSASFYTWIVDSLSDMKTENKFNFAKSETLQRNWTQVVIKYQDDKSITGYSGTDDFSIEDRKIFRGNFIIVTKSDSFTTTEGMVGLGYTPSSFHEKYSLWNQWYWNRIIFHKVFTQDFTSNIRGEITFGEIPKHVVNDYTNYGRCDAWDQIEGDKIVKNPNWQCAIKGLIIGNDFSNSKKIDINVSKVSFFSYRKRAWIPLSVFDKLEEKYFKDFIWKGKCERIKVKRYDTFSCKDDMLNADDLTLVFDDWGMRIPADKLFTYVKEREAFEFIFYHKKDFEKWTLGRPIVRNYLMVYDNHNQEIGFYSKDNVVYLSEFEAEPPKWYEYIPDKEIKNTDQGPIKRPIVIQPEDLIKPNPNANHQKPKPESRTIASAFIIQLLFFIFVAVAVSLLIGFGLYIYIRYRRKTKFQNSDYYVKATGDLAHIMRS